MFCLNTVNNTLYFKAPPTNTVHPTLQYHYQVYTALEHVMVVYSTIFNADYFIYHDRSAKYGYNFMQVGERRLFGLG